VRLWVSQQFIEDDDDDLQPCEVVIASQGTF
jgi:hypothetical protein